MQLSEKYMIYKQRVRDGQMGIIPQFWMIYQILWRSSITSILQYRRANLMGECVRGSSSYPFTFPPTSTAMPDMAAGMCIRWETDSQHSGNEIIFSVRSQARYSLRTAADQRGEQSLNKDAKTVGGVRRFSADNDAVTNWTMGRADQAWNLNSLLQTCNIRQQYDEHKHTRPSQILQSESRTSNVVAVLDNDYVNPFDIALDRTMLINLSSGPEMETSTKLLSLQQDGITLERVSSRTKSIIHEKVFWSHSYKHQYVNDGEEKLYHKEKQPDHGWSEQRRFRGSVTSDNEKWPSHWLQGSAKVPVVSHTTESELSTWY